LVDLDRALGRRFDLRADFTPAERWSDVRPDWPAEPIQRFSPGTDSGTFDYFVEAVMTPANGDDAAAGEDFGRPRLDVLARDARAACQHRRDRQAEEGRKDNRFLHK
jgi:ABC-type phosphate transport system substrate-binding protein